jgi:hypothetical protein
MGFPDSAEAKHTQEIHLEDLCGGLEPPRPTETHDPIAT